MIAFKEIQLQLTAASCGSVEFFNLPETAHGRVNQKTIVMYADFDKQWPGGNQTMEVRNVAQLIQSRSNLAATEIYIPHTKVRKTIAVANYVGGFDPMSSCRSHDSFFSA